MELGRLLLLQVFCAALDAGTTWLLWSRIDISVVLARIAGACLAAILIVFFCRRAPEFRGIGRFLATSISLTCLLVSYGIFALLMLRNPVLQWPLAFAAASGASLLLSWIGYWRARQGRVSG
ncbi:hypothetical protein [uncultured Agrobacterium sp.]|uniref:hypothetical protein n=1 Tax=uncultured Agrobacterium sp. TaxID=157277 RepID=UPI0025E8B5BE|nr:hypothetical protein [uncultured Agrobacterium sp.]